MMQCPNHDGQHIGIVCVTCSNELLCPACLDDHTQGHTFQSIQKVASQIQQQLQNDLLKTYPQYLSNIQQEIKDIQVQRKDLDVLESKACEKINAQRQRLHKAIDESADDLIGTCKQRKEINLSTLRDRENFLSTRLTEISKLQIELNKIVESKNYAEVITTSKSVKFGVEFQQFPPIALKSFDFQTCEINQESVDSMLGLIAADEANDDVSGCLESLHLQTPEAQAASLNTGSDFVGSVRSEVELSTVSTISNEMSEFADSIVPFVPGHAWVRWWPQKEIQLTDREGHVTQTVKFKKGISRMTTSQNTLLVCGWTEKCIYRVQYGSTPTVYLKTPLYPSAICSTDNGNVYVGLVESDDPKTARSTRRIVNKYDKKGQELSSAEYDSFGDRLFSRPLRISVNDADTAVAVVNKVDDMSANLVLLDTSLNLILRYDGKVTPACRKYYPDKSGQNKFYVRDALFNPDGNILLAELGSKSIQLLDSDCQLLQTLWRDDLEPKRLCLHNDGELWCGFIKKDGGVIKVLKSSK